MYPIVFSSSTSDFSTQGYGALSDCIMCEVTEELNGAYTLELTYPLNGLHSEYLTVGNIIVAKPNHNQMRQPFRISEVKKSFANNFQVYANHICYDLSGYPLRSAYSYSSLQGVLDAMNGFAWSTGTATYNQFEFGTDMSSSKSFSMPAMQTMRSWMGGQEGSIIDVYGGEWIYNNFSCFLTSRRGRDTGIRISYGKNLAEYEKKRNFTEYSHVCAYWKKSDSVVYGDLTVTGVDCPFRCAYIDASNEFESQPTAAQLNTYANSQIAATNFSTQTITVSPAQIDNEVISLGDSVLICYDDVFSTRVIKTVWDVLAGQYKKFQLGTKQENISETIKSLSTGPNGSSGGGSIIPADYIIEEGNNNNWDYRKWASGVAECWQITGSTAFNYTSSYGNGFFRDNSNWYYPANLFVSAPTVRITPIVSQGLIFATVYANNASYCKFYTASLKSETNLPTAYSNYAIGRWK